MSKRKLEVGERIFISSQPAYRSGEPTLTEYEIVEANNSSAYAVSVSDLSKEKPHRTRIVQRTKEIVNHFFVGYSYTFWKSKESFEQAIKNRDEKRKLREEALERVNKMSLSELRNFMAQ